MINISQIIHPKWTLSRFHIKTDFTSANRLSNVKLVSKGLSVSSVKCQVPKWTFHWNTSYKRLDILDWKSGSGLTSNTSQIYLCLIKRVKSNIKAIYFIQFLKILGRWLRETQSVSAMKSFSSSMCKFEHILNFSTSKDAVSIV